MDVLQKMSMLFLYLSKKGCNHDNFRKNGVKTGCRSRRCDAFGLILIDSRLWQQQKNL